MHKILEFSAILGLAICIEGSQLKIGSAAAFSAVYFALRYVFSNLGAHTWGVCSGHYGENIGTFALIAFGLIFLMLLVSVCQASLRSKKNNPYINLLFESLEQTPPPTNRPSHSENQSGPDFTNEDKFKEYFNLSSRETEILSLLVRGTTTPYIAKTFYISEATVRTHIRNIYKKTDVHKRSELVELYEEISKTSSSIR